MVRADNPRFSDRRRESPLGRARRSSPASAVNVLLRQGGDIDEELGW